MKRIQLSFRGKLLILSMLLSTVFLGICSKSSPLYPLNDWVDVHCFFTMGRGILDGMVPYRDLYEQKGPVLYFLYALAALISDRSFWGVFLLEVVSFGLFLYYSGRTAMLYLGKSNAVYYIMAFLALVIPVSKSFSHGGSCELTSLYLLAYGLYSVLAALQDKRPLRFGEAFLNGIFAAMALYIKFTMLGFYMGLAAFVILWYVSFKYSVKTLFVTIGQFLLGVAAVSAVVFGYFAIHAAVEDFLTVYFYNNLFLYPQETEGSKLELIQNCLKTTLQYNGSYSLFIVMGIFLFLARVKEHYLEGVMALLTFLGLVIGTYWGGRGYTYYGLILSPFAVFGVTAIAYTLRMAGVSRLPKALDFTMGKIMLLLCCVTLFVNIAYTRSQNVYLMRYEKEDHPAYRFAQTINRVEDPKIINYGFLDGGFYYAADVQPSCKFFCTLNINAPDMWAIQREFINNEADFVITRKYTLDRYSANSNLYTLVDTATFRFEGVDFTYYLYQRK